MAKFKVTVVRRVIEALDLEIDAIDEDEAEAKAVGLALDADANEWDSETTDYEVDIQKT
jgi:hypothetical protein